MAKRLTIADYKDANAKLVAERDTFKKERDDAINLADSNDKAMDDLKVELLELLGGYPQHDGYGIGAKKRATKVQIARRAGELVAAERLSERLGKMFFEDDIHIEGAPLDMKPIDFGRAFAKDVERGRPTAHVHTMDCLPPEMREGAKKLVDTLTSDLKQNIKRRRARRAFWSAIKFLTLIAAFIAVGYFGAALIFG